MKRPHPALALSRRTTGVSAFQANGQVGIALFAGLTETMLTAADTGLCATDLPGKAVHSYNAPACLITHSRRLAEVDRLLPVPPTRRAGHKTGSLRLGRFLKTHSDHGSTTDAAAALIGASGSRLCRHGDRNAGDRMAAA